MQMNEFFRDQKINTMKRVGMMLIGFGTVFFLSVRNMALESENAQLREIIENKDMMFTTPYTPPEKKECEPIDTLRI